MKVAIYTRVSTAEQNDELQRRDIEDYATRQGWPVVDLYQDKASGSQRLQTRPAKASSGCQGKEV